MTRNPLTIGELARRVGLRTSAIRYYESIGLLPAPPRAGGRRRYEAGVVPRLAAIRAARELGFTLEEIRTLLDGYAPGTPPPERWRALAEARLPEIRAAIQRALALRELIEAGLHCRCTGIEECFLEGCTPAPVSITPRLPRSVSPPPEGTADTRPEGASRLPPRASRRHAARSGVRSSARCGYASPIASSISSAKASDSSSVATGSDVS